MGRQLNTGRTHFPEGHIPWNKGKKGLTTAWNKGKTNQNWQGEKNPRWNNNKDWGMEVICQGCGKRFIKKIHTAGKFCGYDCYWKNLVGKKNKSKTKFEKGQKPWNKDKFNEEAKYRYSNIHKWINKQLGRPGKCSHCKSTTAIRYEWANVSKEYKRDITDWIRLCKKCHKLYDKKSI